MSMLDAKILAARAVGQVARRAGRGGGTSLPARSSPGWIPTRSSASPRGCRAAAR